MKPRLRDGVHKFVGIKLRKTGSGLSITIPVAAAHILGWNEGDSMMLTMLDDGLVVNLNDFHTELERINTLAHSSPGGAVAAYSRFLRRLRDEYGIDLKLDPLPKKPKGPKR